ncbi:aminoglycoside adenylyltransferase family protein [Streptomyces sp. NPDC050658]|uniref:aminoglycoside adenylyltransferase family protein n=1 Tax=unclassified Streptomyces TaxID=2593676 RepID=UPI0034393FED
MTQTDDVVRLLRDTLGVDLAGAYLYGSAVLGGLRPYSDIDVFAVVERPLTRGQRRRLVDGLLDLSAWPPRGTTVRPVELTVVVRGAISPWSYPPVCEFQYGEWLRESCERGDVPSPVASPDLAPLVTMVLLAGRALAGPPPGELLDAVPRADLSRAMVAGVPDLLAELDSDTRNVVLTLARIWMTLATGVVTSKDGAADWALTRLPEEHRAVLARARAVYLTGEDERRGGLLPLPGPWAAYVTKAIGELAGPLPGEPGRPGDR